MSQDTEGALCSHLILTDLTSPKFLMDTDLFIAWVSAPLWLENGKTQAIYFRHQKSSQSPLRLHVDGVWLANHRVSETSSKPAEEKTQAKSTASCSRQYHPSLLTSSLNTVCWLTKETSHRCRDSRTATEHRMKVLSLCLPIIVNQPLSQRLLHMCGLQKKWPQKISMSWSPWKGIVTRRVRPREHG